MKKRILFVDDNALVLQGLQRSLRPMRPEWEMDFAEGGAKALECVAANAYDVVVSDMMMPGMDGAQVLREIQLRSPQTIRLVLSGHAEQEYAMKCVGVAHQYLSKPCDPDMLRSTLARITSLNFTAQSEAVRRLLPRLEQLPSIPAIYSEIVRLLKDPEVGMEEVGAVIARDMAITTQILKVVNSSFFGLSRRIIEPVEAASYLGVETVKGLVLATHLFGQFPTTDARAFSCEALAQHSQQVGAAARLIAQAEHASKTVFNECLVAGFLHDAGKLVLFANLPEQFDQAAALVAEKGLHPLAAEREVFGATHAEVAGYLLGLWGLPASVVDAIASHHTPQQSQARNFSPVTAVHVADALIWERAAGGVETPRPVVDTDHLAALGFTDRMPAWRTVVNESLSTASNPSCPTLAQ
jgi:HD-like signal output (HDOD) protein